MKTKAYIKYEIISQKNGVFEKVEFNDELESNYKGMLSQYSSFKQHSSDTIMLIGITENNEKVSIYPRTQNLLIKYLLQLEKETQTIKKKKETRIIPFVDNTIEEIKANIKEDIKEEKEFIPPVLKSDEDKLNYIKSKEIFIFEEPELNREKQVTTIAEEISEVLYNLSKNLLSLLEIHKDNRFKYAVCTKTVNDMVHRINDLQFADSLNEEEKDKLILDYVKEMNKAQTEKRKYALTCQKSVRAIKELSGGKPSEIEILSEKLNLISEYSASYTPSEKPRYKVYLYKFDNMAEKEFLSSILKDFYTVVCPFENVIKAYNNCLSSKLKIPKKKTSAIQEDAIETEKEEVKTNNSTLNENTPRFKYGSQSISKIKGSSCALIYNSIDTKNYLLRKLAHKYEDVIEDDDNKTLTLINRQMK